MSAMIVQLSNELGAFGEMRIQKYFHYLKHIIHCQQDALASFIYIHTYIKHATAMGSQDTRSGEYIIIPPPENGYQNPIENPDNLNTRPEKKYDY